MDLRNNSTLSRGLRNNNPFNLIKTKIPWKGKIEGSADPKFEQFKTVEYGVRAGVMDIANDYKTDGKTTIRELIREFAPGHENPTSTYVNWIANFVGLRSDQKIPYKLMPRFLKGLVLFENGVNYAGEIDLYVWPYIKKYAQKEFPVEGAQKKKNFNFNFAGVKVSIVLSWKTK